MTEPHQSDLTRAIQAALKLSQYRDLETRPPGPVACEPLADDWDARESLESAITKACGEAGYHFGVGEGCPVAARVALAWFDQRLKCKPQEEQPAPTAPEKTATPALDALIDDCPWLQPGKVIRRAVASDTAGLRLELDTAKRLWKQSHDCAAGLHAELEAAKAELAEAKRERDEKLANDSGEWLREYQAACARERGLVAENEKLAKALDEAKRYGLEKCEETGRMQVEAQRWRNEAEANEQAALDLAQARELAASHWCHFKGSDCTSCVELRKLLGLEKIRTQS